MFPASLFSGRGREERKEKKKANRLMASAAIRNTPNGIAKTNLRSQATNSITTTDAPKQTLSPTSSSAMNRSHTTPTLNTSTHPKASTIRTVPGESLQVNTSDISGRNHAKFDALPSLPEKATSPFSSPLSSSPRTLPVSNGMVRAISSEFGPSQIYNTVQGSEEANGSTTTSPGSSQWSSAVGRAGQGKSGRVIERLMAENDMLKREVKIQQIGTDNAREEKKLTEEKQRSLADQLDKVLHDAAITKTLLKKRDRQFIELQTQVDAEKAKTDAALTRERGWKAELDRVVAECQATVERTLAESKAKIDQILAESRVQVNEAQERTKLMQGRVEVMEEYWDETNATVSSTANNLGTQIESVLLRRKEDVAKWKLLEDISDQKNAEIERLHQANRNLHAIHEAYKVEQEEALRSIKGKTIAQEQESEQLVTKSKKVLGELQWALAVQQNLRPTQ